MKIPRRPIFPKPYQDPHPPMYLACTRESTLNQAGEWGLGALVLGFAGPEDIAQKNKVYRAAVKRRTKESQIPDFPNEHLAALCPAIVLDDEKKARAIGYRGQRYFTEAIRHWYSPGVEMPPPRAEIADMTDEEVLKAEGEALVAYLHEEKITAGTESTGMFNTNHAYGRVEDAIAYVQRLKDAGADEVMFLIQMGTVPQWAALETIKNLGERVIPKFR
jgi:alkanesulfonate monooxygenase SsuD/methylene tetrahydromethanopterin reductase-like flavin-dependent oxidoreductase (luciferase family)